ncbi:unnamed protein product [Acanthoscelides obtectus]|uniref:Elongation of very long chain fatty acids protein n=1 Tax=Acanthoscelides obtectus TaxID=200917 RepID=A0A9P0M3W4_ACAOB|nr:unnamed protein product [Acanthoscelides obtectus]CAK1621100.1 Elongation of very long chain fatty acids protein 7 [Acanthoscelides obtectus]
MALVLKRLYQGYFWVFTEKADPRPGELGLLFMSSPLYPVAFIFSYFYFIYNLGPRLMENRKPFEIRKLLIAYNAIQILANLYIFYLAVLEMLFVSNWSCDPVDYSYSPEAIHTLKSYHLFFLTKLGDLLETVFFVLRKRYRQVSFLHVYHHFGMFTMLWVAVKFFGGGHGTWVGLINSLVHAVMYTYYLLSAIDEEWKKNVAFKKFITQIQMIQFTIFIIIYGRLLLKTDCQYPRLCSYFFVPQNFFMLILFGDFYRRTYLKKQNPAPTIEDSEKVGITENTTTVLLDR